MTTPERLRRAQTLFEETLARPVGAREEFLHEACVGDLELKREVEVLLADDATAGEFLQQSLLRPKEVPLGDCAENGPGAALRIDGYEVQGRIGRGGMSSVFLADRVEGAHRHRVAIKVVRSDLDHPGLAERFRTEQRILASIDHPFVARLLDLGRTQEDLPYFVMEYVDGEPITEYCDRRRLTVEQRLRLFRKVCEAVHYAHQNLVVHRDLKPRNILVSEQGSPKLLDFGIARLLESPDGTETTVFGDRVLTPSFAAPEHFAGGRITTATDVYSLGVVLHELLTGLRPYDWRGLSAREILERWETQELHPPSATALSARPTDIRAGATTDGDRPQVEASRRRTSPTGLARQLAGDLDNIVLRALRFDAEERYGSVEQLSEDIRRHLEGLPVAARPATRLYRLGKFLRRHTLAVINAAVTVALLMGFVVVTGVQSRRIARERDTAQRERALAERERERAETVRRFLIEAFELADPFLGGSGVTAKEILDRGAKWLDEGLAEQPRTQATVEHTLGALYNRLGLYPEARVLLEQSLEHRRSLFGSDHATTAETLAELATTLLAQSELEAAEAAAREALAVNRQRHGVESVEAGASLRQLADLLGERAHYDEAESQARDALDMHRRLLGGIHREVAMDLNVLMKVQFRRGDVEAAEQSAVAALEISRQVYPPRSAAIANNVSNLGTVVWTRGRYQQAKELYLEALEAHRASLGEGHPTVGSDLNNLGNLHLEINDTSAAESYLRQALDILRQRLGDEHHIVARCITNLGLVLTVDGRLEEAEALYRQALATHRTLMGEDHPMVAEDLQRLGSNLFLAGRIDEAEQYLQQTLTIRVAKFGEEHVATAETLMVLARVARQRGNSTRAEEYFRRALHNFLESRGDDHWLVGLAMLRIAEVMLDQGRLGEAERLSREGRALVGRALSEAHWRTLEARGILGGVLAALGRFEEAERELLASYEAMLEFKGTDSLQVREVARRLVGLYERWQRPADGDRFRGVL